MPATNRLKVCIPCAQAKRKCDKQLPECQRCLDRDVDCVYPKPKRRRRQLSSTDSQTESPPVLQNDINSNIPNTGLEFRDWTALETPNLVNVSLADLMMPYNGPVAPTPAIGISSPGLLVEPNTYPDASNSWFLKDDTWALEHCTVKPTCEAADYPDSFIGAVREMLQRWTEHGCNNFIHRHLYKHGMPTCTQDAFTTLIAYHNRTPATRETMLRIAEERTAVLIAAQGLPNDGRAPGLLGHLARVHSLFVYQFIRLFDGSVRHRAAAERLLPLLRRWVMQMVDAARQYRGEPHTISKFSSIGDAQRPLSWVADELDAAHDATAATWRSWIVTESTRRTHLVVSSMINAYMIMRDGWADCTGTIMLTVRRGLWEAGSAVKWFDLCRAKSPLLVPPMHPEPLITHYAAEEVDEFAMFLWTFVVGGERIKSWIDGSKTASKTLTLTE